jgi:hypothetical protein
VPILRTLPDVEREIRKIMEVGEGTSGSPYYGNDPNNLAHHYQFGEIFHKKKFIRTPTDGWDYIGEAVPFPESVYQLTGVASDDDSKPFNEKFTELLNKLHVTWTADPNAFGGSVGAMFQLAGLAQQLMANGKWPSFKFLGDTSSDPMGKSLAATYPSVKAHGVSRAERPTTASTRLAGFYEVTLPSGHRIHVPEGFDEAELRRLLSTLTS